MHYVANQPRKAQDHFYGVREAKPDLVGIAIYDRLDQTPPTDPNLTQPCGVGASWRITCVRREVLLDFAGAEGRGHAR